MNRYKYNKKAGALQEAIEDVTTVPEPQRQLSSVSAPPPMFAQSLMQSFDDYLDEAVITSEHALPPEMLGNIAHGTAQAGHARQRIQRQPDTNPNGLDHHTHVGQTSMFFYTIEEGQQALLVSRDGTMEIVQGPRRVWRWGKTLRPMHHHVAHPGDFLIVRYRDGRQEHLEGPAHVWFDPRKHMAITKEEALPIADKEAVVVYSEEESEGDGQKPKITRRLVDGPTTFVPKPGEWLHTFSWHGSAPSSEGYKKVPNALIFQKLWKMPDQMYHDVTDVRTADDAVLTIRLMIFFELTDIERMLVATHDPIGDFINAATSDVIQFVSDKDFDTFKHNTFKLNDLSTYEQLTTRATQCGYKIDKVVYRGYGAPASLQQMHDQAIESRTKLKLQRATEEQAQQLEDFKLERQIGRQSQNRQESQAATSHELEMTQKRQAAELEHQRQLQNLHLEQYESNRSKAREQREADLSVEREHLKSLAEMGVNLTEYLTQSRADQVIELRDPNKSGAQLHLHNPQN